MTHLQVFDRPSCCPTGVCGPNIDPALARFAADLESLRAQGVTVERYNLAQEPAAFVRHEDVKAALASGDISCLPLFRVDGHIVFSGKYPSRSMLARWCGLGAPSALSAGERSCCGPECCS